MLKLDQNFGSYKWIKIILKLDEIRRICPKESEKES